ncbi:MAG: carboxypeptidase-like regulatory domain-containing protein, partial [Nitrososphaerales archaeon]
GNDLVSVGLSGAAKNGEPWQISLNDYTTGQQSALISLQNKSSIFSPFYDKSSASNALLWGADQSPAIDFAFEIGHSLANDCSSTSFSDGGTGGIPGDGSCDSYWPGLWSQTGLIHIYLPIVGTSPQLPSQISFSSSQGGVSEVYKSSQTKSLCKYPSFSTSVNCIYPFYVYEYNTSSFVFLSSRVSGSVNDYGNAYQFPGTNDTGQYISNIQPAPSPPTTVTTTKTATSVSTLTSTVITALTQTATVVSTVTEQQAHSLTVETRSPGGSALSGQTITISNLTGFSMQGTTDSSGRLVLTGLSPGSSYTASSNISGVTLSATVTLNGNSVILLEPTPSQTNHSSTTSTSSTSGPPPPIIQTPYLIFIIAAITVVAIGSFLVLRRRR